MNAIEELTEVLAEGITARPVEDDIFSVLPEAPREHLYDRRAAAYDLVVATRLYNMVMWGDSPREYASFARHALASSVGGSVLDAACGSLLFSAGAYLACARPIIAFDQSLAMLKRARARLSRRAGGRVPEHVVLLQADLGELPFRPHAFQTVLCMNVLHQYEHVSALVPNLKRLLTDDGRLFLTSLVLTGRLIGDGYLRALHASGEFVRPRTSAELECLLNESLAESLRYRTRGNMAYATTAGPA